MMDGSVLPSVWGAVTLLVLVRNYTAVKKKIEFHKYRRIIYLYVQR
jgi:hypothetical protein